MLADKVDTVGPQDHQTTGTGSNSVGGSALVGAAILVVVRRQALRHSELMGACAMADAGWLADPIGRINNLSLTPSRKTALRPMFEALMNSIQAIEKRFGRENLASGAVDIELRQVP